MFIHVFIHLKNQIPGKEHSALYTLIERLNKQAVRIQKLSINAMEWEQGWSFTAKHHFIETILREKKS